MPSLTDLAPGLVNLCLNRRLPRGGEASRHWRAAFAWAAATALAQAIYHAVLVGIPSAKSLTWAALIVMVVIAVPSLLAASVVQVLGRSQIVVLGAALGGRGGVRGRRRHRPCQHHGNHVVRSLTMANVVGLWIWAWRRHHPTDVTATPTAAL